MATSGLESNTSARTAEIAFIDAAVSDIGVLLSGLRPNVQAIILRADEPALLQMARALQSRRDLASIHIIAHGTPGTVSFAAGALTVENLARHAGAMAAIGGALADDGEILLWSCQTGKGDSGRHFTEAFSSQSGARVAAATGLVGSAELGGGWVLDAGDGAHAARPPLRAEGMQSYAQVLVITSVTDASISTFGGGDNTVSPGEDPIAVTGAADYNGVIDLTLDVVLIFDGDPTKTVSLTLVQGVDYDSFVILPGISGGANFHFNIPYSTYEALGLPTGPSSVAFQTIEGFTPGTSTSNSYDDVTCFARGTWMSTPDGERAVEDLTVGDLILTQDGSALPIKWIGHRRINVKASRRREMTAPVCIRQGAFIENVPHRDLLVSPDHAIFVDGMLICARQLLNGTTIRQELDRDEVEYFHIEMEVHTILLAEGLATESYLDTGNRGFFVNGGAPLILHPDLMDEADHPTREANSCAPFVSDEAHIRPVWERLAARAAELGSPTPILDTTREPALRLIVKGKTIQPVHSDAGLAIFVLPRGVTEVCLASRACSPTDTRPWLEDRRILGVRVARIVLRSATESYDVPIDHPALKQGWWAIERDGPTMLRRWTNGNAFLALPEISGPAMLEVHLSDTLTYLTLEDESRHVA